MVASRLKLSQLCDIALAFIVFFSKMVRVIGKCNFPTNLMSALVGYSWSVCHNFHNRLKFTLDAPIGALVVIPYSRLLVLTSCGGSSQWLCRFSAPSSKKYRGIYSGQPNISLFLRYLSFIKVF